MNSAVIFVTVAIVFSIILLYKKRSSEKDRLPDKSFMLPAAAPDYDNEILILSFNSKEYDNAYKFGIAVENRLYKTLSESSCISNHIRVEFVTVGLYLLAVIRINKKPKKEKRGIEKLWNLKQ